MFSTRYAITFAEVVDSHFGCEEIGTKAANGFTLQQLRLVSKKLDEEGIESQLITLHSSLPEELQTQNQAGVLLIRNALPSLLFEGVENLLYEEQSQLPYDTKYYDGRMKRTLTKRARHNIVFGEEERQPSQDYKIYRVKAFKELKYLPVLKQSIEKLFGEKAANLKAEGNKYFDKKSGMGFHGDCERKIVICVSLGRSMTLRYYWRSPHSSVNQFGPIDLNLKHGDIYVMSEKATGNDWRKRSHFRLVHGVGAEKYIGKC